MRLPYVTDLDGVDVAVLGLPFDTATSFRSGARFGPEAIRSASALLRPYNPEQRVDIFAHVSAVDAGDLPLAPGRHRGHLRAGRGGPRRGHRRRGVPGRARRRPLDHPGRAACAQPPARAAGARAPRRPRRHLARVLRPALLPRHDVPAGGRGGRDRPVRLGPGRHARVAVRARGHRVRPASSASPCSRPGSCGRSAPAPSATSCASGSAAGPCSSRFDVDFCDPAFAPGTGTPEVGGPSSGEALEFVRALHGVALVGCDVVEVAPPYDSPGQPTALLGATVAWEAISLHALARAAGAEARRHEALLRRRRARLREVLAQVPRRRQVLRRRHADHGRRHHRQADGAGRLDGRRPLRGQRPRPARDGGRRRPRRPREADPLQRLLPVPVRPRPSTSGCAPTTSTATRSSPG